MGEGRRLRGSALLVEGLEGGEGHCIEKHGDIICIEKHGDIICIDCISGDSGAVWWGGVLVVLIVD